MKPPRGKLRNKILLLMLLVGVVPLAIAAILTYYVVGNAHRDDVAKLEAAVLTQTATEAQDFISNSVLAQTRIVVPYGQSIQVATSAAAYVLQGTLASRPYLLSESFVDLSGQETVRADQHPAAGAAAATTATTTTLRNFSADPGFLAAKAGSYYIGQPSYPGGDPEVAFASPVKDDNGEIIAVVRGTASLAEVQRIIASANVGSTGYLYLVDQKGTLIGGGGGFQGMAGSSSVTNLDVVASAIAGRSLLDGPSQMRYESALHQVVIGAALPISEYGQTWGLVAEWPAAEADAVMDALLLRDLIILLAVLGAVIAASILFALFIVRPVKMLEEGTARVAQGKFSEGVNITTGDELQELGESFNAMEAGLKELEQLKDEFVFIAAHELRTPVAAMKGYLQLILEGTTGAIGDGTKSFIQKVLAANQRLIQLVNDLLEVARSQAGRLMIQVAPIDIVPALASTLDELKSLADEKSVALKFDPPAGFPPVLADADRVKEVMVNLVGNAIKYMGGAGTVTVSLELAEGMAVTRVADTGLGISKEAQEKLFQKFYRVQTDKTKEITGTGLGLFIVKEIIEKMHGTISVISEEGQGSTFIFSLPVASGGAPVVTP